MNSSDDSHKGWVRDILSKNEYGTAFASAEWTESCDPIDDRNALWKQYVVFVDLYKYYLEVAWKVSVWYYATTGAILTYFLAHVRDEGAEPLPFVLLFLTLISLGLALVIGRASRNMVSMMKAMDFIATTLQVPGRPHVEFAGLYLLATAGMILLVGLFSGTLFVFRPWEN
jgi:hypothetical protein